MKASSSLHAAIGVALALMFTLAGCGNSRTPVPDPSAPVSPNSFKTLSYPDAGVAFSAPANWIVTRSKDPLVTIASSGNAVVALWRFVRVAAVPADDAHLGRARDELIRLSKRRDPNLQVIRSKLTTVAGAPAVEIDAFQQIAGQPRRVRSLHIYIDGAEIVFEEYAPPASFHAVDHAAFSPMKRSLRLLTN